MTLSEAFILYDQELLVQGKVLKTRKNYRSALNSLVKAVGDIPVELLSFEHVKRWQLHMKSCGMQPSSVKTNLCKLREVFKHLRRQGVPVLDSRDIDLPSVPRKEGTWLDYSEIQQLLDVITSPRDKAIVACLFATGARIGELLSLNRDSIKDGQAYILGKGDKPGIIYFDGYALKCLDEYLETRKDNLKPLFISGQYRRITVSRVEQLLHVYEDMAGLEKSLTPHTIRRSFASDLVNNGAGIYEVSKLLRHSQIATTSAHYAFVKDKFNRDNHNKYHSRLR